IVQGWGMTETSPVIALGEPPRAAEPGDVEWRLKAGRIIPGVECRVVTDEGVVAPWDGETVGELEVRGPWVTGTYLEGEGGTFHDGWLRTGDVGTIDDHGFVEITDRLKDMVKSGGEWIPSVVVEGELAAHRGVAEAAVIAVPDDRWGERPAAVIVPAGTDDGGIPGSVGQALGVAAPAPAELRAWLEDRVVRWWVPDRWAYLPRLPRTGAGKVDKKLLRAMYARGELAAVEG
ncbi:MAG: AMP-binding enzyme, partial [Acidimicrobiales bacterium]